MKILFHLGHPAHYHLFKHVIHRLQAAGHRVFILIKNKDVLEDLLKADHLAYLNILPQGHDGSKRSIALGVLIKDRAIFRLARAERPDLMVGTSIEISHVGRLLGISSVVVNEDDYDAVPLFAMLSYPFAETLVSPSSCKMGRWQFKSIPYSGYHELAYLHPSYFQPDLETAVRYTGADRYCLMRFASLTAHHDAGRSGINRDLARRIMDLLERRYRIFISSERPLEPEFESYRIKIKPSDMHHVLSYADLYIGDSQTMTAEAAVLGTPALRFNDFVGRLGYLEELEHRYHLTYGFKTSMPEKLLAKIKQMMDMPNLKEQWQTRRQKMLAEKIDVTAFMVWFIENYPDSVATMRANPYFQYRFQTDHVADTTIFA